MFDKKRIIAKFHQFMPKSVETPPILMDQHQNAGEEFDNFGHQNGGRREVFWPIGGSRFLGARIAECEDEGGGLGDQHNQRNPFQSG